MTDFLPFSRPCLTKKAIYEVTKCLKSNWLSTGPRVIDFETQLASYFGTKHAVTVNSATAGLFLSLKAIGIQEGDEVITTPFTFVATINAIIHAGAKPILVDIDPISRNIQVDLIEKSITSKTKAIMPVHFAGLPVEMDRIISLAKKYNLRIIEDAAHAMGALYKGKKIGSFGDIQVFSFHPCKNLTTAEGGCITTNDDEIAELVKNLRFFGIDRDAWNRKVKNSSSAYDVKNCGYKHNMSDLQATIGLTQLEVLDKMNQKRYKIVKAYHKYLKNIEGISLPNVNIEDSVHSWHIFTILINKEKYGYDRHELEIKLKERNIGTGHHYPPVHLFSYYKNKFEWKEGDFINAENVGRSIISLPLFPYMKISDTLRVTDAIKDIRNGK